MSKLVGEVPLQRKGDASDIAAAALYLATAPYVTGVDMPIDGCARGRVRRAAGARRGAARSGLHVGRMAERASSATTSGDKVPLTAENNAVVAPLAQYSARDE